MNISKNRLQGFASGTPAYVILHGLLNLTKGHNFAASFESTGNPVLAFREAVVRLTLEHRSDKSWPYARGISTDLYDRLADKKRPVSAGEAHMLIHRDLEQRVYTEAHVNTFSADKLIRIDRATRLALTRLLPEDREGNLLIITARSPDGRMVILTN